MLFAVCRFARARDFFLSVRMGVVFMLIFPFSLLSLAATPPASVQICAACHGSSGAGSAAGVPRIAGMNADYLAHALTMFKAGTRRSDVMQPIAKTLSDADINALAHFFSAQNPPLAPAPAPATDLVTAGNTLAMHGGDNGVPACFSCHGENGRGNGQRFPGIAGEPDAFVVNRLHEFQVRAKADTPKPGSMTEVASKLTEEQIHAAAAFLSVTQPH
ncbi:c-type cytochrome [Dyella nitratireducens]|nr:c-type cytochrome [Dyella nitratireducens]